MRKLVAILAVLAAVPAGAAFADDDDCFVPMADWQPREAVQKMAEDQGWTVRRIKTDDGCYEVKGTDAAGRPIEATVHPATLAVIEVEYDDHDRRREREGDRRGDDRRGDPPRQ
ncbi:MAG TPA: PepSY domain-containing protein [Paracoccus sp. (in: a-proteobacteria)]|nr:PepSY domain-containing protein [Paracoccus sp. (in: a-proteobacteria)]